MNEVLSGFVIAGKRDTAVAVRISFRAPDHLLAGEFRNDFIKARVVEPLGRVSPWIVFLFVRFLYSSERAAWSA